MDVIKWKQKLSSNTAQNNFISFLLSFSRFEEKYHPAEAWPLGVLRMGRILANSMAEMASSSQSYSQIQESESQGNAAAYGVRGNETSVAIPGLGDFQPLSERGIKRDHLDEDEDMAPQPAADGVEVKMEAEADSNSGTPPPKKKRRSFRRSREGGLNQPKNPLMALNELKPGLKFEVVCEGGQPHAPLFEASVNVDGQLFQGKGPSKQKAKHSAAESVLRSVVQFRVPESQIPRVGPGDTDFTADTASGLLNAFGGEGGDVSENPDDPTGAATNPVVRKAKLSLAEGGKHPVMLLNEVYPGAVYEFMGETGQMQDKQFIFKITIDGKDFVGTGASKKKARANTAAKTLQSLFGIRTYISANGGPTSNLHVGPVPGHIPPPLSTQLPQEVADRIAEVTMEKFTLLQEKLYEQLSRRKVLASVITTDMSENGGDVKYKVISIGTGTKFVSGEYMSDQGLAVNDCHGEIIARRSLQTFLYSQLSLSIQGSEEGCIFEKKETGLYGLRKGIDFHLYINTSPCGDARVFSPHEATSSEETDKHPGRKNRGLLRVKLENGEGQ